MADPVTPVPAPTIMNTIDKDLQDSLASLAHKHVTVTYVLIGVLVFVLALGGVGAYIGVKWVDASLARAEASEKLTAQYKTQYDALNLTYQNELAAHAADRAADAQKQAALISSMSNVNQKADTSIAKVLTPGKTATEAFADLKDAYKGTPSIGNLTLNVSKDSASGEQLLTFTVPEVQQVTATKLDRDRLTSNLDNVNQQLTLEKDKTTTLTSDLTNLQTAHTALIKTETQCETTVADYKKVVKPSKFKIVLGYALKGALFAGGIVIGHRL